MGLNWAVIEVLLWVVSVPADGASDFSRNIAFSV
jgi:hypothetical protein